MRQAAEGAGGGEAPRWEGASRGREPGTGSASLESEGAGPSERRRDQKGAGIRGGMRDKQRFNGETPRGEGAEPERGGTWITGEEPQD